LSCVLTACGFHLRGTATLPPGMSVTYVQDSDPASSIARPLRQALQANGGRVTANAAEATATLRIVNEAFERKLVGVGGTAREKNYELQYRVAFTAAATNGAWALDEQGLTVVRELIFDETQVLGKTAEQEQLHQTMVQDAARQILLRLRAQAK
jgi:LPS-assembly lipoprotein